MTALELIKRAKAKHNELGPSEPIEYRHISGLIENVKCFTSNKEYTDQNYGIRKIENVFSQVVLSEEPKDDDTIVYEGDEYRVTRWEKQYGYYMVYAEARRRHTGQRMKHKSRGRGVR